MHPNYSFCIAILLSIIFLSGCLQNESKPTENGQNQTNISQESPETANTLTEKTQKEPSETSNYTDEIIKNRESLLASWHGDWTINEPVKNPENIYCTDNETGQKINLATAINQAQTSACTKFGGPLNGSYSCEESYGNWQLGMEIKQNDWCYTTCSVSKYGVRLDNRCAEGTPWEILSNYDACEDDGKIYYLRDAFAKARNSICTDWGDFDTPHGGCSGSTINSSTFVQYQLGITPNENHKGTKFVFCNVDLKENKIWVSYVEGAKCHIWDGINTIEKNCTISE